MEKVDVLARKIMNLLMQNSRQSSREISKQLKTSAATVISRMQKLEKARVIKKYSALVDYEKLGYDVEVVINIKISKGKLFQVEKKIAVHPNVFAVYDITGDYDVVVLARFQNRRALDTFLKNIQTYDFVDKTHTTLILNVIKDESMSI